MSKVAVSIPSCFIRPMTRFRQTALAAVAASLAVVCFTARRAEAQAQSTQCMTAAQIRKVMYFANSKEFRATPLGRCAYRVEATTAMGSEHPQPGDKPHLMVDRLDAVFEAGHPVRYIAVYESGTEDERDGCFKPPCIFNEKGRILLEGATVAEAEAASTKMTASQSPSRSVVATTACSKASAERALADRAAGQAPKGDGRIGRSTTWQQAGPCSWSVSGVVGWRDPMTLQPAMFTFSAAIGRGSNGTYVVDVFQIIGRYP